VCREALLTRARSAERKGRAGGSSSACWWWLAPTLCALRAKCRPCKPLSSACRCRLKAPPRWFDAARRAASNHVGVARRGRTARPRSGLRRASGSERQKKPDSGHLGLDRALRISKAASVSVFSDSSSGGSDYILEQPVGPPGPWPGSSHAHRRWASDVPWSIPYRKRLGHRPACRSARALKSHLFHRCRLEETAGGALLLTERS
jgi:hypothetical protein